MLILPEKLLPLAWVNGVESVLVSYDLDSKPSDIVIEMRFVGMAKNNDFFKGEPF